MPLPPWAYAPAVDREIYARLHSRASLVLEAGYAAVLDAVYRQPAERDQAGATVGEFGCRFAGLWLEAPLEVLLDRVSARKGDASDAGPWVAEGQWLAGAGEVSWARLDASADPQKLLEWALSRCGSVEQAASFGAPDPAPATRRQEHWV